MNKAYDNAFQNNSVKAMNENIKSYSFEKLKDKYNLRIYLRPYKLDKVKVLKQRHHFWWMKRTTDILCSLVALILLLPLFLYVSLAIVIDDPKGGPFFRQKRVGRNGKEFNFYKFRSMCVDAEDKIEELKKWNQVDGPAFKMQDDPRITKVGKKIRRRSVDELPQLINVLKGDMSIVGPRPPLPREVKMYDEYQMQRLMVTPGLTCIWQVAGARHKIPFDLWTAMDIKYIAERKYLLDIMLILKTLKLTYKGEAD